jgi:AcrR family transcriptional regulator
MSPRAGLDKALIVQAAVDLINNEGIDALTLNRLARKLNVQPPSLYNHIEGLPGLMRELALLNAQQLYTVFANAAVGKSGEDALMSIAQAYRGYIKECPGLYTAGLRAQSSHTSGDSELQKAQEKVVIVAMAVVESFGLSGEDALHAVRGFRSLVHGFATIEISGGFGLPLDCDESFRRLVMMMSKGLQQTPRYLEER